MGMYTPSTAPNDPLCDTFLRQWTGSSLVHIMAGQLINAKPLSEPLVTYRTFRQKIQWKSYQSTIILFQEINFKMSYIKCCFDVNVLLQTCLPPPVEHVHGEYMSFVIMLFSHYMVHSIKLSHLLTIEYIHKRESGVLSCAERLPFSSKSYRVECFLCRVLLRDVNLKIMKDHKFP